MTFARLARQLQVATPQLPLPLRRMSILGKQIRDEFGQPFCIRGFNQGHGEYTTPNDPIEDVQMGANTVRIIWRKWGNYSGSTMDGQGDGTASDLTFAYLEGIVARVVAAKLAGLKVILAGDSNCGQNGKQGYPTDTSMFDYCTVDGYGGANFYVPQGASQLLRFYQTWQWMARRLYGLVDFYEPLVEPSAVEGNVAMTQAIQDNIRSIIKREDPYALFIMGGYPAYYVNAMNNVMLSKWIPEKNSILTCDMLDGIAGDTASGFADTLSTCLGFMDKWNCPFMVNQFGDNTSSDPHDALAIANTEQLRLTPQGSIGWTWWEKVSVSIGAFGVYYQPSQNAARIIKQERYDHMATMFKQPAIAMH